MKNKPICKNRQSDIRLIERSRDVLVTDFPEGKVILNMATYIPYMLNSTASDVWDFCKKPRRVDEIASFICRRYETDITKARKDIMKLIRSLRAKNLIKEKA